MGDIAPFPPPVTGERYDPAEEAVYWRERRQSQRDDWRVEHRLRNKAERERDDALDSLDDYVEAIAEGRIVGPAGCWTRHELLLALSKAGYSRQWHDLPGTTHADVLALLDRVIAEGER